MQGWIDQPLNAKGAAQAAALGRYFAEREAAAVYSSDLARAQQTAQPIAKALGLSVQALPALRERGFGRCEGLTFAEISARYPEDAQAIVSRDPDYAAPGGGESRRQHETRVLACVEELLVRHPVQTLVLVTHGQVLDAIFRRVHGLPLDAPRGHKIPNGGLNWVGFGGGQWVIETWGETSHLALLQNQTAHLLCML